MEILRSLIFLLIILFTASVSHSAQNRSMGTISDIQAKGCISTREASSGNGKKSMVRQLEVDIDFKLHIRNTTPVPIIVSRESIQMATSELFSGVDKGAKSLSKSIFYLQYREISDHLEIPDQRHFTVLAPNDETLFEEQASFETTPLDVSKFYSGVSVSFVYMTWSGKDRQKETIKSKWGKFGQLFTEDIITPPAAFKLEGLCKQQS